MSHWRVKGNHFTRTVIVCFRGKVLEQEAVEEVLHLGWVDLLPRCEPSDAVRDQLLALRVAVAVTSVVRHCKI